MKSIVKLLCLIGAPILMVKPVKAQSSQPLPEFDKIKADGGAKIELVIADRYSVYSETTKPIQLKVNNGTLLVDDVAAGQVIKIYAKTVSSILLDDAAQLECKDTIRTTNLTINMDGGSKATLLVVATNININQDGSSLLTIAGTAQSASIQLDGAAKLKAEELSLQQANVETDGIAFAKVAVSNNLTVKTDGASSVRYVGTPTNKTFAVDGASSIKSADGKEDFSQHPGINTSNDDTTRVTIGNKKLIIVDNDKKSEEKEKPKHMKSVYAGFELGLNSMVTPDMNFKLSNTPYLNTKLGSSVSYGLNLFEWDGQIVKNKIAFTSGFGMTWSNYHFEGNSFLTPHIDSLNATPSASSLSLNKLYTYDLNAPFLIKFAPGKKGDPKKGFHFAAGAIVRYMVTTQVVTESTANGYKQRVELTDDFNINPFRVDATVRVGYNKVKLFANYALTPYFNSSKAPDVRNFSAGLTLIGF